MIIMGGTNLFSQLPEEIIRAILRDCDITSLSALAQTSKPIPHQSISYFASTDETWFDLVKRRFHIASRSATASAVLRTPSQPSKITLNPKHYGGTNWRDVYRSMDKCNRMPKMKTHSSKKITFAKGSGYGALLLPPSPPMKEKATTSFIHHPSPLGAARKLSATARAKRGMENTGIHKFMAMWVSISHTENCNLRRARSSHCLSTDPRKDDTMERFFDHHDDRDDNYGNDDFRSGSPNSVFSPTSRRSTTRNTRSNAHNNNYYIELHVSIQNTTSSFSTVEVDIDNMSVHMMTSSPTATATTTTNNRNGICTQGIVQSGPLRPRLMYQCNSRTDLDNNNMKKPLSFRKGKYLNERILTLKPFEFVTVAVALPLVTYLTWGEDIRFETDFLSRAVSVNIPVTWNTDVMVNSKTRQMEYEDYHRLDMEEEKKECEDDNDDDFDSVGSVRKVMKRTAVSGLATAKFCGEQEIWEHYMELPGGCLTLADSTNNM